MMDFGISGSNGQHSGRDDRRRWFAERDPGAIRARRELSVAKHGVDVR